MSRVKLLVEQMVITRHYTEDLIENVADVDWFRQPSEGVTHVAWQVGHLAVAEYHLALVRVRGEQPADADIITTDFRSLFGKGSTPTADASAYPSPEAIRKVFDVVHRQALAESRKLSEDVLDESIDPPHPMFSTKFGALRWCAQHEMLHAGQIGMLRRLFGSAPLR